jgi:hypothetical protein
MAIKFKSSININDQYTLPTNDGTVNQTMVTDGAGNLFFANATTATLVGIDGSEVSGTVTIQGAGGTTVTQAGQNITIDSSSTGGGSSGTLSVEKDGFTGDGTTVSFTLSSSVQSESQTQVYIDGVYQPKANYGTSGSVITFIQPPASGAEIEVIHLISISGIVYTDSFTGNGATSEYTLSNEILVENDTQVYFDGVYQSKDNYITSGSTITFSENVPSGIEIEVVHLKGVNLTALNSNQFTGTGSQTVFFLSEPLDSKDKTFVFIEGVYQEKSTYFTSGDRLVFATAPQNGFAIEVMAFNGAIVRGVESIDGKVGVVSTNYAHEIISINTTAEKNTVYVLKANLTLTLPATPIGGDSIKVSNLSSVATCIIGANGNNIMATAGDLTLNDASKSFELIYTDTANGWVIIL